MFDVIIDPGTYSDRFKHMGLVSDRFSYLINIETMRKEELEESALTTSDISKDIIPEIYPASRSLEAHKQALTRRNI